MPKQPAFPGLANAMKKKRTRREVFLSEMDAVVPWRPLLGLIEPHYPRIGAKGGSHGKCQGACLVRARRWLGLL